MEFLFQFSPCDAPGLEEETAELLRQRLEAHSRRTVPGLWKAADKLNARAAKGPDPEKRRRRYRICGIFLLALGIFVLVPGLMAPGTPSLIGAGVFALLAGGLEFCLAGAKGPPPPPSACRKEAAELLDICRNAGSAAPPVQVRFDGDGWTVTAAEDSSQTPYAKVGGIFETDRLWLLVDKENRALLLQKKDLVQGEAAAFSPWIRDKLRTGC